jgi:hypothetical protein
MGVLTSDPGPSDTSFTMTVLKANHAGKAYKLGGSATVDVDAKTKIHRHAPGVHGNKATIGDLALGDYAKVKGRVCKTDLANNATPDLAPTSPRGRSTRTRRSRRSPTRRSRTRYGAAPEASETGASGAFWAEMLYS